MARDYTKSKGKVPDKIYMNLSRNEEEDFGYVMGPYFTKQRPAANEVQVEWTLCKRTGNYIRFPSLEIGKKKSLDL